MTEKDEKIYELFKSIIVAIHNVDNGTFLKEDEKDLYRQLDELYRAITR